MARIGFPSLAILLIAFSFPVRSDEPSATEPLTKATELVKQLGASSFAKREAAAKELLKLGEAARPALQAGSNGADVEIRQRCKQLLTGLRKTEIDAKAKAFLAVELNGDLPGWSNYAKTLGKDAEFRKFYASVFVAYPELLTDLETNPEKAKKDYFGRCLEIKSLIGKKDQALQFDTKEFAALLVLASSEKIDRLAASKPNTRDKISVLGQFLHDEKFWKHLCEGEDKAQFRKIFLHWFERESDIILKPKFQSVSTCLWPALVAIQHAELKEALGTVEKLAFIDLRESTQGAAIAALGKIGTSENLKPLQDLLYNRNDCSNLFFGKANARLTVEIRDAALGAIIQLNHCDPGDFDFDAMKEGFFGKPTKGIYIHEMFGFESNENRVRSHKKWNDFIAAKKGGDKKEK